VSFLVDTNVLSEGTKPRPSARVGAWLAEVDEDRIFLSVVTLAEVRYGVERLPPGRRREQLNDWLLNDLPQRFEGRVLSIDTAVVGEWGVIVSQRERAGRPIGVMDAFLAATANVHDLTLVTRNADDFRSSVKSVFNPWT
jgi:predicted nucleic acid-binding protein